MAARPSNTIARKKQIIYSLMSVMATRGYDGASISEIARSAGLTKGLIHYHFKNKQEILIALLQELGTEHQKILDGTLSEKAKSPVDQMAAFIDFHLSTGTTSNPEVLQCWIVISAEALRQTEIKHEYNKILTQIANLLISIIERGISQKEFYCTSPEIAASAILATIQGYYLLASSSRELIPRGSAAQATKQMATGILILNTRRSHEK